jgi:hypothetical protein
MVGILYCFIHALYSFQDKSSSYSKAFCVYDSLSGLIVTMPMADIIVLTFKQILNHSFTNGAKLYYNLKLSKN